MLCKLLRPGQIDEDLEAIREERVKATTIQRETMATLNGEVDWFLKRREEVMREKEND